MMMSDSIYAAVTQASLLDYYYEFVFSSEGNSRTPQSYGLSVVSVLTLLSGNFMCFALSCRKGKEVRLVC